MQITDVRVRKITKEGKMRAIVSITIDDEFVIHDIKVIEGEKGMFIAMPSKKATDGEYRDIAHPINVGGHGDPDSPQGEIVENLTFRQIDILEQDEDDIPYQGCMAVVGDKNWARNILFEDIRVESIQEGRLFHLRVEFNPKYNSQPGCGIDGVTFRNISYDGVGEHPSWLWGLDAEHVVQNVTFDNVVIRGKKMEDLKEFVANDYVRNIKVK